MLNGDIFNLTCLLRSLRLELLKVISHPMKNFQSNYQNSDCFFLHTNAGSRVLGEDGVIPAP
jgi:hypothetical protein